MPDCGIFLLLVLFSGLWGCGSDINEAEEDATPPRLENTIPSDGDVNVSTTLVPKVGFNEAIRYAGNGFFLVNGGQNVQGTSRLTEGRTNELCFIPNRPLEEGQVYTIRLNGSTISDLANNEAEYRRYSSARNFVLNDHSVIKTLISGMIHRYVEGDLVENKRAKTKPSPNTD